MRKPHTFEVKNFTSHSMKQMKEIKEQRQKREKALNMWDAENSSSELA